MCQQTDLHLLFTDIPLLVFFSNMTTLFCQYCVYCLINSNIRVVVCCGCVDFPITFYNWIASLLALLSRKWLQLSTYFLYLKSLLSREWLKLSTYFLYVKSLLSREWLQLSTYFLYLNCPLSREWLELSTYFLCIKSLLSREWLQLSTYLLYLKSLLSREWWTDPYFHTKTIIERLNPCIPTHLATQSFMAPWHLSVGLTKYAEYVSSKSIVLHFKVIRLYMKSL